MAQMPDEKGGTFVDAGINLSRIGRGPWDDEWPSWTSYTFNRPTIGRRAARLFVELRRSGSARAHDRWLEIVRATTPERLPESNIRVDHGPDRSDDRFPPWHPALTERDGQGEP